MKFWLGVHEPAWLSRAGVPLFVSVRRMRRRKSLPKPAIAPWALDSGGFTELSERGRWSVTVDQYVEEVASYAGVGMLEWAAPMDWMCEPFVLEKTGLSVREHQERTVQNFLDIRHRGPFIPVLQGFTDDEYHACVDLYYEAGVNLAAEPLVGVGSVCRRQHTHEIRRVISGLADRGLAIHGFGVKTKGLPMYADRLASADSMSWSLNARKNPPLPTCNHDRCNNCMDFALAWRKRILGDLVEPFPPLPPAQTLEKTWVVLG